MSDPLMIALVLLAVGVLAATAWQLCRLWRRPPWVPKKPWAFRFPEPGEVFVSSTAPDDPDLTIRLRKDQLDEFNCTNNEAMADWMARFGDETRRQKS